MKTLFTNPTYSSVRLNVTLKVIVITIATILLGMNGAFAGNAVPFVEKCVTGNATATNIKYYVNNKLVSGLRGNVTAGSKVKVTFTTASNTTKTRFSLVSYKAPSASFDEYTASQQVVFDFKTEEVKGGSHSFEVTIPSCYFQVDFVLGCIIEKLGPAGSNNFYSPQNRLLDADNGGATQCSCQSSIDVSVPELFATGYPDTSSAINVDFKNKSTKIQDRINVFVQSTNNWKVEMRNPAGNKLYATDNNGDGNWDYVNSAYDLDANGQPETNLLAKSGGMQSFMFLVYAPENAGIGTLDTLRVFGASYTDHCAHDMDYGITEINEPFILPIELLYFSAKVNVDHVRIDWATATELNNEVFTIERSKDGVEFNAIEQIKGAGNSNSKLVYSTKDILPEAPVMYYRLMQTDFDGTSTYSQVVAVKGAKSGITLDSDVYPNPFNQDFTVVFNSTDGGNVVTTLMDIQGKVVAQKSMSASKGHNQFVFAEGNSLPKGIYFMTMEHNGAVITSKLSKLSDF